MIRWEIKLKGIFYKGSLVGHLKLMQYELNVDTLKARTVKLSFDKLRWSMTSYSWPWVGLPFLSFAWGIFTHFLVRLGRCTHFDKHHQGYTLAFFFIREMRCIPLLHYTKPKKNIIFKWIINHKIWKYHLHWLYLMMVCHLSASRDQILHQWHAWLY